MKILDYAVARKLGIAFNGGAPSLAQKLITQKLGGGGGGGGGGNTGGGALPDKYTWEGVFARIDAGTYSTDYAIGDLVPLDLGSEGVINMQIAAFDRDTLADGSGTAKITFVAQKSLRTTKVLGSSSASAFPQTTLYSYLEETIKPLLPEKVRNRIAKVGKDSGSDRHDYDLWLPGSTEIGSSYCFYHELFPDATSCVKGRVDYARNSEWWTRTARSTNSFYFVKTAGDQTYTSGNALKGVCIAFCTN